MSIRCLRTLLVTASSATAGAGGFAGLNAPPNPASAGANPNKSFTVHDAPPNLPLSLGVTEADGEFTSVQYFHETFGVESGGPGENETRQVSIYAADGNYKLRAYFDLEVSYGN